MRNGMLKLIVVLACTGSIAGGCAKKEMLRTEEPVAPAARPESSTPAPRPGDGAGVGAVREQPVREPSQAVREEPMKDAVEAPTALNLDKLYFDYDSYVLSPAARDSLSKISDYLQKKNTAVQVQIEGHCDERGSDEYNMALGEKRAKVAHDYLTSLGVSAGRLSTISYGEEKPAELGQDETSWAKNRRVEFKVVK